MAKYIELIDKYRIEQGEGDYNPPSYVWMDNTGEIVRCGKCRWHRPEALIGSVYCVRHRFVKSDDWFCADGEREAQE